MDNASLKYIKSSYEKYNDIIDCFGINVIQSRIDQIYEEMRAFLTTYGFEKDVRIDLAAITHAVMDYFTDIRRLKEYQKIEHANQAKIKAYETFWLLKRHPLSVIKDIEDDKYTFINEKFLLMRLSSYLMADKVSKPIIDEQRKVFDNFLGVLLYNLKYRDCSAHAIELMILAFEAGKIFG